MISLRFYRGRSAFLWSSLRTSQTAASSSWLPTRTSRYFRTQRVLRVEESKVQGGDDVHKPFSEVEEDKKQSNDDSQKPAPVSFRGIPYFMFFIFVGNAYFIGKDAGFREKSDAQQTFEHHPILPFTFKEANKKLQAGEDRFVKSVARETSHPR